MKVMPLRERTVPLRLAPRFVACYEAYVHWLEHLLDRLGREAALTVWYNAFDGYDEGYLVEILSAGWQAVEGKPVDVEAGVEAALTERFVPPVEKVTVDDARRIVEVTPPIPQVRARFPSLDVERDTTTYEGLHLLREGLALLAKSLLELHGKQGELIAYDTLLSAVEWSDEPRMGVEEFLDLFKQPKEGTPQAAGLDYELICASDTEVVLHIKECEWVRYYQERHPEVGYLLACSLDEAEYRAIHPRIRMQRTTTLMEGGGLCDFRIYAVES